MTFRRFGNEFDPAASRSGYLETLGIIHSSLAPHQAQAADLGEGQRLYAAVMPGLEEYGAGPDDHHVVFVVRETTDKKDGRERTEYQLFLYHMSEDERPTRQYDWDVFRTNFDMNDLADYGEEAVTEWRALLRDASNHGLFSLEEAWYRVEDDDPALVVQAAGAAALRAEELMLRAIRDDLDQRKVDE